MFVGKEGPAVDLCKLGSQYRQSGEVRKAERCFMAVLSMRSAPVPQRVKALQGLCQTLDDQGRYAEAESLLAVLKGAA